MEETKRIHYFHADASSFGGALDHPVHKIVPSQAEISLPATGGFTSRRGHAFSFEEIVSCEATFTRASGGKSHKNGSWTTSVTSAVDKLNILEVVTADRVVSQVSVEHPLEGHTPKVTFVGSQFVNLRIGGVLVDAVFNKSLLTPGDGEYPGCSWTKHSGFMKDVRAQHASREKAPKVPKWAQDRYAWVSDDKGVEERGHVVCSLVDSLIGDIPGNVFGHVVEIPEFGKFFFGEIMFDQGTFQLTMVRAELGCAVGGSIAAGTTRANGRTFP